MKFSPAQKLISRFCVKLGRQFGYERFANERQTLGQLAQYNFDDWSTQQYTDFYAIVDRLTDEGIDCDLLLQVEIVHANGPVLDET